MHSRFGIGFSPGCPCGAPKQDTHHILQECPLHTRERGAIWPTGESLQDKLYGSRLRLELTTEFIKAVGIAV